MAGKIEIVDYNPEWEKKFKCEAKNIKAILGKNCLAVHHIGSTSVKGLKAKPIIDIMPVVKDILLVDMHNEEFEALGYECKGEYGIPNRRFFIKGKDSRTHHIHIFEAANQTEIDRHLAVRDYLKSHPKEAQEYENLKTQLAEKFTCDNDGYRNGKNSFVKNLEKKALRWKQKQENIGFCMSVGMCIGVGIGASVGLFFDISIGIGMGMGINAGMCIGLAFGYWKNK